MNSQPNLFLDYVSLKKNKNYLLSAYSKSKDLEFKNLHFLLSSLQFRSRLMILYVLDNMNQSCLVVSLNTLNKRHVQKYILKNMLNENMLCITNAYGSF